MDDWEEFNEASLPEKKKKKDFYSHLNMQNISHSNYAHAKRVYKGFEINNLEEYHDLHIQSDTFLSLRTLETCVSKFTKLINQNFF